MLASILFPFQRISTKPLIGFLDANAIFWKLKRKNRLGFKTEFLHVANSFTDRGGKKRMYSSGNVVFEVNLEHLAYLENNMDCYVTAQTQP